MDLRRNLPLIKKLEAELEEKGEIMSSITEDLYRDILLRLPVKSLIACKCVCMSWYQLISSSDFVKMHLDLTISRDKPNLLVNFQVTGHEPHELMFTIGHKAIELLSSTDEFHSYAIEMDYPYKSDGYSVEFLGSCNGLVCLWLSLRDRGLCCLWNPASKEYRELPIPHQFLVKYQSVTFTITAFGYDCMNDDYKLLIGEDFDGDDENGDLSQIQVYSLRSNSWKGGRLSIPYGFSDEFDSLGGVLVHGNLHWLSLGKDSLQALVSLDISLEKFQEVELPKEPSDNKNKHPFLSVGVLEGCLCLLVGNRMIGLQIWVMQDYGVRESWTKRCVITHERITRHCACARLICSFKSGKLLLGLSCNPILYDPKNGIVIETNISRTLSWQQEKHYFESLVSLNTGIYVGDRMLGRKSYKDLIFLYDRVVLFWNNKNLEEI